MSQRKDIKKVLIIGSGPIIIGQACEFDYSGTQACKALRNLGYEILLVNSNPATIMTDPEIADVTYIEPLNVARLEQIIAKERPDALLPNLGGQSGLNLCSELAEAGILEKYNVEVIGVQVDAIERGEDRIDFKNTMDSLGIEMARSEVAYSVDEALAIADKLGYPVVLRPAYTMGGAGGGLVYNVEELKTVCARGLQASLVGQVLVEESILGWEELELEVVRDTEGNIVAEGVGGTQKLAKDIQELTGIQTRATILGHLQRGGSPTATDRMHASMMGYHAVKAILEGKQNVAIAYNSGKYEVLDLFESMEMKKTLDQEIYDVIKILAI